MHPDGQLIGGRYALDELIASGGMGEVWRARDTTLNRDVAVKVLRAELTADPTFLARFRAEAQHAAGLVHPHIATLFDYGEVTGPSGDRLAYLVMELVRGESLSALLRRERRLPADRTLDVLRQSAAGLGAAHAAGVVHRDVKPGNVLLGPDGAVKLTDFGVAVSAASVPLTQAGEVIGTANYLSPEQAEGGRATPASDVYALGLVGYECLAGHRGFDGGTPTQIAMRQIREVPPPLPADVPEPVRRLIERATAKDPAQRFADGAAFRAAIDDVLAGRSAGAEPGTARTAVMPAVRSTRPVPTPPLPPRTRMLALPPDDEVHDIAELRALEDDEPAPERRRRWPWLVAALLTLLVAGGATAGFLQLAADRPDRPAAAPSTSSSAPPTVQLVTLSLADLVGRPVAEVQAELLAQQLQVTLQPQETADAAADTVLTVNPVGELTPGAVVTVAYAVAPPPPPAPAPEPEPAPTPEPPPAEDPGDQDDPDQGNPDDEGDDGGDGDWWEDDDEGDDDGGDDRGGRGGGRGGGGGGRGNG